MKKIIVLLFTCVMSMSYACTHFPEVEKASHILDNAWRHIEEDSEAIMDGLLFMQAEHALKIYFAEFYRSCAECQITATYRFGGMVRKLESFIDKCIR